MSRIRVLDLAKELGLETKIAIVKLQEIGVQVKNHFNAISDIEADKLRAFIRSGKNPEKEAAAKAASKVVIRRRAAETTSTEATASGSENGEQRSFENEDSSAGHGAADNLSVQHASAGSFDDTESSRNEQTPAGNFAAAARGTEVTSTTAKLTPDASDSAPVRASASSSAEAREAPRSATSETRSPDDEASSPLNTSTQTSPTRPMQPPRTGLSQQQPPSLSGPTAQAANLPASLDSIEGLAALPGADSTESRPTVGTTAAPIRPVIKAEGAVIVRRAEPQPPPQPSTGGYIPRAVGGPRPTGGIITRDAQGGYRTDGQGGFRGGDSGAQSGGGYRSDGQGGYRSNRDGGTVGSESSRSSNVYHAGGQNGYQPRPQFGAPREGGEGTGGGITPRQPWTPGQRPAEGGYQGGGRTGPYVSREGGGAGGIRPAGTGGPYTGGPRPAGGGIGGGGPRLPFSTPDTTPAKDGTPTRAQREREKEREIQKRRLQEEEEGRKNKAAKSARNSGGELLEEPEFDPDAPEAAAQVRTMIPNRKRVGFGGALRKKDLRKVEAANPTKASKKVVRVDENISVSDLASELSIKSSLVIKSLMKLGMLASVNQILDPETATLVAQEFGFEVQNTTVNISDILQRKAEKVDSSKSEHLARPPVVTIMGHVDHGKTSLLDAIRSTSVASREAGGITQHIGAYQVEHNGQKITFLDTPGHEAFTSMRARGAKVTDIVILVVAADDGVMPQTIEAIAHAKAANVPIVVAINKMDKPGASVERIQRELAQHNVTPEEWGGEAMFAPVSAKTQIGIPELLESVLLQAEVLDLKSPKEGLASGIVIESKLDKARGPVATVIVTNGTLKQSDWIVAGTSYGRIRAMFNDKGEKISSAEPATPVEIIGLSEVPASGDSFNCVFSDAIAKEAVAYRQEKTRQRDLAATGKTSMEDILARLGEDQNKTKELALIVKADTHGSVEAIRQAIKKLDSEKVRTKFIHSAVGGITETDISLAQASDALVVGFNVRPDKQAATKAERDKIDIKVFSIIYELIAAVQNAMVGRLAPVKSEKLLGHAEVRSLFSVPKIGVIAGAAITDGKVTRNSHIRIVRDGIVIYTGRVSSLRRFKDDAKEVLQGFECGIGVENYNDLKVGDVLESFVIEESAATLD